MTEQAQPFLVPEEGTLLITGVVRDELGVAIPGSSLTTMTLTLYDLTSDAIINRDRNLKLQYLAGLGLNLYQSDRIYSDMLMHAKYPEGLFTGSEQTLQALREGILRAQGRGM